MTSGTCPLQTRWHLLAKPVRRTRCEALCRGLVDAHELEAPTLELQGAGRSVGGYEAFQGHEGAAGGERRVGAVEGRVTLLV